MALQTKNELNNEQDIDCDCDYDSKKNESSKNMSTPSNELSMVRVRFLYQHLSQNYLHPFQNSIYMEKCTKSVITEVSQDLHKKAFGKKCGNVTIKWSTDVQNMFANECHLRNRR